MDRKSRLKGGLYGLLVGDALGVPYEFHPASAIPPAELVEMSPPPGFRRAHASVKPGTWSDDGALALCLLDSLIERDGLDMENLAQKFLAWEAEGYLAVDGRVFDIGIQTSRALDNLRQGLPPETAGPSAETNNGNGSLMRVLPLPLWHRGTDEELVVLAHRQSLLTHGHVHSQVCCGIYVLVARRLLEGRAMAEAWELAETGLLDLYARQSSQPCLAALEYILSMRHSAPNGSGYVVDTLWSVREACGSARFEDVLKKAISLGNDTDTTACVAGGLAGIHFGFEEIPGRWLENLRGRELVEPLEEALLRRA